MQWQSVLWAKNTRTISSYVLKVFILFPAWSPTQVIIIFWLRSKFTVFTSPVSNKHDGLCRKIINTSHYSGIDLLSNDGTSSSVFIPLILQQYLLRKTSFKKKIKKSIYNYISSCKMSTEQVNSCCHLNSSSYKRSPGSLFFCLLKLDTKPELVMFSWKHATKSELVCLENVGKT